MMRSLHKIWLGKRRRILHRQFGLQFYAQNLHDENRRAPTAPRLHVSPTECLYSVVPEIRVEELEPAQPITIKAQMVEDRGKVLHANAHFVADNNGRVNATQFPSLGGSYKGVFPSGLLSMLKLSSEHFEFGRIHKLDMQVPVKMEIFLQDGHKPIHQTDPYQSKVELKRHFIGSGVKRIPVRDGRVRGILYVPSGDGPFPGVIDMFGATGVLQDTRAALNASRGIASLALAYFNYEDIPPEKIIHMDLDYLEEAVDYLCSHPEVISEKCGVIANCFGGYLALWTAIHIPKVKAAFIINAPIMGVCKTLRYKGEIIEEGNDLSFKHLMRDQDGTYIPKPEVNEAFKYVNQSVLDGVRKALKDTHFAVAIGEDDTYHFKNGWKNLFKSLGGENEKKFTLKMYPRAGHLIPPPYTPFASTVYGRIWSDESYTEGFLMKYAGDSVATVEMKEDTWKWMLHFINTHIRLPNVS